jgi:hypothetical protein
VDEFDTDLTTDEKRGRMTQSANHTRAVSSRDSVVDKDPKASKRDGRPVDAFRDPGQLAAQTDGEPPVPIEIDEMSLRDMLNGPFTLTDTGVKTRLDYIKESHALLSQFTPRELKILMNLKRNTSTKAWSLREDLVVLTLTMSNRELAELLRERNKEAVKKRLQLLRSKGLSKR